MIMGNIYNGNGNKCPICERNNITINCNSINDAVYYYDCPDCGQYFAPSNIWHFKEPILSNYNISKLRNYLFYNRTDNRAVLLNAEDYSKYITDEFVEVYNLTPEMVETWYPKSFVDKINKILLWLANKSRYMGDEITVKIEEICLLFFMYNKLELNSVSREWGNEFRFTLKFLLQNALIGNQNVEHLKTITETLILHRSITFVLTEIAWRRIYELQINQSDNKNVFVAMKFGAETLALREKIKEGLEGYNVRIMDEIEHNHQIVPEMLFEIRNSKFVIAELSNHNNGAYYEAGYALGLGKEVIHICQKSELSNGLHFDVAQVNTIIYENIDEIPAKLQKRIRATIK